MARIDEIVEESDSEDKPKEVDIKRETVLKKLPFGGETAKIFIRMRQDSRKDFVRKDGGDDEKVVR